MDSEHRSDEKQINVITFFFLIKFTTLMLYHVTNEY